MGSSSSSTFSYDAELLNDVNSWALEVPGSKEPGFSAILRNKQFPDGYELPVEDGITLDNVWALFSRSAKRFTEANCMGFRPYEGDSRGDFVFLNYGDVHQTCVKIACGLNTLGLKQQDTVGLYSKNRAEWMQVHLANQRMGYQTVALYDTLGDEAVAYIMSHADLSVVFCERGALQNVVAAKQACDNDGACNLSTIVIFDFQNIYGNQHEKLNSEDHDMAASVNCQLLGLSELISRGSEAMVEQAEVSGDDCCFLMYTSGTTGKPKGVQLSHRGFSMVAFSVCEQTEFYPDDRHLSFLPLAHIFECLVETTLLNNGASIAYYQGNIKKLTEDWVSLRPTVIIGVPRVFAKVYDKVMARREELNCIKKYFFNNALSASSKASRTGERVAKWDDAIWTQVAEQVGFDQCRLCLSGAAPLPPYLAEFLRIVLVNGVILQGYGMTESTGGSTVQSMNDLTLGNVGVPLAGVDIRLEDIPDMGYMSTDENPRGEICIRGPSVMMGYLKNEKATAETVVDGWLHTGDVGRINPNGTISIIDRKKNLFKTAFGEYIAVEKIESAYGKAASCGQIWIYGNSFKNFIVAVVVPDALWAKEYLRSKGVWLDDGPDEPTPGTPEFAEKFHAVAQENMDTLKAAVLAKMRQQQEDLKRFEHVKDIMLETRLDNLLQGFSVENNLLTPSFKLKRPILLQTYVEQLKELYTANGEPPKPDEHWVKK